MEICGIDEAGRGPIAGPLVFAGVVLLKRIDGITDSKKLTPKKREELFEKILKNSVNHIVWIWPEEIDEKGLSFCIKKALLEIKSEIKAKTYIFDGNSNFGVKEIQTIIKGDLKVKEIGAASILAKVSRDKYMIEIADKYPMYNFKKHKGYITKEHIEEIKRYGFSDIHRKSYKLKALEPTLF
jgi:ribonuclease HII